VKRAARLLLVALALTGCEDARRESLQGPPTPRATVRIDPARVGIGQVAVVELTVVTPPSHHVAPLAFPSSLPGLWLLETETQPPERLEQRWVHRSRTRVRGREAGRLVWPALRVQVEGPQGERRVLETEPRPIQVTSARDRFPERVAPFPLRPVPGMPASRWLVLAFVAGSLCTWAVSAGLVRRRERRAAAPEPTAGPDVASAWEKTLAALRAARSQAPSDPRRAASRGAASLRHYLRGRFGIRAEARTTEELTALRPPLFLVSRWPTLLGILRALDESRFRPEPSEASRGRVSENLALAEDFVTQTAPLEVRR
jgi:hypothetical protein